MVIVHCVPHRHGGSNGDRFASLIRSLPVRLDGTGGGACFRVTILPRDAIIESGRS